MYFGALVTGSGNSNQAVTGDDANLASRVVTTLYLVGRYYLLANITNLVRTGSWLCEVPFAKSMRLVSCAVLE